MKLIHIARAFAAAFAMAAFATSASALTSDEASAILFMKQEEKLARDVYQALHARWGSAIFANIAVSEQKHMDAISGLIARYRLKDPTPAESGKFTYPELQELYDELVEQGEDSLEAALNVGVTIEEADIEDLRNALRIVREKPVRNVFGNLLNGSFNHLAAFRKWLTSL